MQWKLKLAEYKYEIKYKPGKKNKNAGHIIKESYQ